MVRLGSVYGFINHQGEYIVQPKYDHASLPEEGLILVKDEGKYGYLDLNGEVAIPLSYNQAEPFFQGKAQVELDGARFYIDKSGRCVEGCGGE